ncbi:MAG TPA: response regulator transcription factor [Gaiellaceae bacterium]|jgi:DNA-binding NarL/FixJ family response regulator|nr:response regulator transcription factor [Gaiellaceae bacterium]
MKAVVHGVTPLWVRVLREFAEANGIEVVGVTGEDGSALQLILDRKPDLFIVELAGSDLGDELEIVREARHLDPSLKIIVIGEGEDYDDIARAVAAGVDVYVFKNADPADVAASMRHSFGQPLYFHPLQLVAASPANGSEEHESICQAPLASLTKRELEILRLVSEGHTNARMASMLWLTEQTIKFHLSNLYRKLEVANRTEAAHWARDHGALAPVAAKAV